MTVLILILLTSAFFLIDRQEKKLRELSHRVEELEKRQ